MKTEDNAEKPDRAPEPTCSLSGNTLSISPKTGENSYVILVVAKNGHDDLVADTEALEAIAPPGGHQEIKNVFETIKWAKGHPTADTAYALQVYALVEPDLSQSEPWKKEIWAAKDGKILTEKPVTKPSPPTPPTPPQPGPVPAPTPTPSKTDDTSGQKVPTGFITIKNRMKVVWQDLTAIETKKLTPTGNMLKDMKLALDEMKAQIAARQADKDGFDGWNKLANGIDTLESAHSRAAAEFAVKQPKQQEPPKPAPAPIPADQKPTEQKPPTDAVKPQPPVTETKNEQKPPMTQTKSVQPSSWFDRNWQKIFGAIAIVLLLVIVGMQIDKRGAVTDEVASFRKVVDELNNRSMTTPPVQLETARATISDRLDVTNTVKRLLQDGRIGDGNIIVVTTYGDVIGVGNSNVVSIGDNRRGSAGVSGSENGPNGPTSSKPVTKVWPRNYEPTRTIKVDPCLANSGSPQFMIPLETIVAGEDVKLEIPDGYRVSLYTREFTPGDYEVAVDGVIKETFAGHDPNRISSLDQKKEMRIRMVRSQKATFEITFNKL